MPNYSVQDIDALREKGVLSNKDANFLKQDLIEQKNQEEGILRKFLSNLSKQFTDEWTTTKARQELAEKGKKGSIEDIALELSQPIEFMAGTIDTIYKVFLAAGQTAAEPLYGFLVNRGVNPSVANYTAAYVEQAFGALSLPSSGAVVKAIPANVQNGLKQAIEKSLGITARKEVEQAGKATAEKAAAALAEQAAAKTEKLAKTNELLDEAAQAVRGEAEQKTSTAAVLDAAYQTTLGKKPAEAIANEMATKAEIRVANRQLNKMSETVILRGGAPTALEEVGATARARKAFEEGAARYESRKVHLVDLQEEAKKSKMSLADVMLMKEGEAKTAQEVANISRPMRESGEMFIKQVDEAEEALAKGDYEPFHRALAEFNFQVHAHWPYMAPRQVAGQALKTYDEPVLSATHYLQQIPKVSSWLGKLKMTTPEEVEANAGLILREMQKIQSPDQILNFSKTAAKNMAELGDEILDSPTFRDYARFYFVNSLMSGTDTIGRNFSGNIVGAPWHYADKVTSSVASKVLNPFLSAEHHIDNGYLSEANTFMSVWSKSLWDASRYALTRQYDKLHGLIPDESALMELTKNRYDLKKFATTGTTNPFTGVKGQIIGAPVTIAQAADEVARIAFYRASVAERLKHEWIATKSTVPWGEYLEAGYANVPPSIHEHGLRLAGEFSWSDKMSAAGQAATSFREILPGTEFVVPFIRTVDRLTAGVYNHTPVLNLFSSRLKDEIMSGDPVKKSEALGRILWTNIVGAGAFMGFGAKAPDGMNWVTGGGPTDRALASRLREDKVHLPYSIWTPAGRLPYHSIMPVGGQIGMIADAREIWDEISTPNAETYWSGIVLAMQRNMFDTSYARSFSEFFSIWDNPHDNTGWERFAANTIKGFVEPSIARQIMREIDPTVKEVHGFYDELVKEIPGMGLPAKRNRLTGEPIMNPPRAFNYVPIAGWVLPTSPMQPKTDAFANKIRELGIKLPDFYKSFGGPQESESPFAYQGALGQAKEAMTGIPIPDELREKGVDYMHSAEMFGQTLTDEANNLIADPEFNKLAPIDQAENIKALYNGRMSAARARLGEENPELMDAYAVKMQQRAEVRMPQDEQAAFEQTIEPKPAETELPVEFIPFPSENEQSLVTGGPMQ